MAHVRWTRALTVAALVCVTGFSPAQASLVGAGLVGGVGLPVGSPAALSPPGVADSANMIDTGVCSGSVVRFTNSTDADRALVLTNGHCVNMYKPNGHFTHKGPSSAEMKIYGASGSTVATVRADQLVYGTETGPDLGLYRLTVTYGQLRQQHSLGALTLSEKPAQQGATLVLNAPRKKGQNGFPGRVNCVVGAVIPLVYTSGKNKWWSLEALRFEHTGGCQSMSGTSGAPMVDPTSGQVMAVHAAGNPADASTQCKGEEACEMDAQGNVTSRPAVSYSTPTYWLYSCLNASREVDIKVKGCRLPGGDNPPKKPGQG